MSNNTLRDWTVMVYISADNDLQDEAFNNLSQLVEVGGNENVHVVAQIDSREGIPTRRYFMQGPNDAVSEEVPEPTNSGCVEDLVDFVKWGSSDEHKAENYLIVLWGHANGIFDDEDDQGTLRIKRSCKTKSRQQGTVENGKLSRPSVKKLNGPDSALTSFELKEAFQIIEEQVLCQKVAILGMDACLMSMAEIAKQVSGNVEIMVASEEVIPEKSWPYARILQRLLTATETSTVEPEELAKLIVDEYISRYEGVEEAVTLSACRVTRIEALSAALAELGHGLTTMLANQTLRRAISKARSKTQMFLFREYVDLFDFCDRLVETLQHKDFGPDKDEPPDFRAKVLGSAQRIMDVIGTNGGNASDFVLHCRSTSGEGGSLERAHGVSIYFPPLPATYADLDLSEDTNWNNFVLDYMNAVFRRSPEIELPEKSPFVRSPTQIGAEVQPATKTPDAVVAATFDQPEENGEKARLWLPRGTRILDMNSGYEETLENQAFLIMSDLAEIRVPEGTELNMPRRGIVKASTGTSTKASTGTSTKASTGTSTKASTGTSTKASTGTSTKASTGTSTKGIRRVGEELVVEWLDVPKCTLDQPFLSGKNRRELSSGTKIKPPKPAETKTVEQVEPIIVIDDVKFVVFKSANAFRNPKAFEEYLQRLLETYRVPEPESVSPPSEKTRSKNGRGKARVMANGKGVVSLI